jgi:hypothetical protein
MRGVFLSLSGLKAAKSVPIRRLDLIVCMSNTIVFYHEGLTLAAIRRVKKLPVETHPMNFAGDNSNNVTRWT